MKIEYGFIADFFANEYQGGAELTTHALMESYKNTRDVWAAKSEGVDEDGLFRLNAEQEAENKKVKLIFGNFNRFNPSLLPTVITLFEYYVIEYDYKFCEFRSIHKHEASVNSQCDCETTTRGKIIEQFYSKAKKVFFMSEEQRQVYRERFPNWSMENTMVLGSAFTKEEWRTIEDAKTLQSGVIRKDMWVFQDSSLWIKGSEDSEFICENKGAALKPLGFKNYDKMSLLNLFSGVKGFAFHPRGHDTCPRVVIEAKLMDCDLDLNDNVQMRNEDWFANGTYETMSEYLKSRTDVFWETIIGE